MVFSVCGKIRVLAETPGVRNGKKKHRCGSTHRELERESPITGGSPADFLNQNQLHFKKMRGCQLGAAMSERGVPRTCPSGQQASPGEQAAGTERVQSQDGENLRHRGYPYWEYGASSNATPESATPGSRCKS